MKLLQNAMRQSDPAISGKKDIQILLPNVTYGNKKQNAGKQSHKHKQYNTMATLIKLKIDVTKLDKNLFFKAKSGAVYADLDFWLTDIVADIPTKNIAELIEDDQYGQCGMIRQDVGAERRKAGEKGNILGNGKMLQARPATMQAQNSFKPTTQASTMIEDEDDDIPF